MCDDLPSYFLINIKLTLKIRHQNVVIGPLQRFYFLCVSDVTVMSSDRLRDDCAKMSNGKPVLQPCDVESERQERCIMGSVGLKCFWPAASIFDRFFLQKTSCKCDARTSECSFNTPLMLPQQLAGSVAACFL